MKKTLLVASILAAVSGSAIAGGFDGPLVRLGIGGSSTSSALSGGSSYSESNVYSSSWDYNKNMNGFGYGLGGKYVLAENIYGTVDLMGVSYRSTSYENSSGGDNVSNSQFLGLSALAISSNPPSKNP